jgi:hypothetical protein
LKMKASDLPKLGAFFAQQDLEWKPIAVSKKTGKALAAAYLPNRAIQDRLDEVCGASDWRNVFKPGPAGGVLCGIAILIERADGKAEWVTKWDGAENTDVEAVKGGLSGSMKRAASQWNIGRYLYRLPNQWVPVDERGRFSQEPRLPREFLPYSAGDGAPDSLPPSPPHQGDDQRRFAQPAPQGRQRRP